MRPWGLRALGLLIVVGTAGCGGPGGDAPRFWYDETSRQRLPGDYRLPDDPGDPDNTGEYLNRRAPRGARRGAGGSGGVRYDRRDGRYYDESGPVDDYAGSYVTEDEIGRGGRGYRLGADYQGRELRRDADYRDERLHEAERHGYGPRSESPGMDRPRVRSGR
jgi:hypothetical protein